MPLAVVHWLLAYKIWPGKPLAILALAAVLLALRLPWLRGWLGGRQRSLAKSNG